VDFRLHFVAVRRRDGLLYWRDAEFRFFGVLLIKQGLRELGRLVHPNAQLPVRHRRKECQPPGGGRGLGFFSLDVASFTFTYLLLAATGLDLLTAFSAVAACINNLGPGLGMVGGHYNGLSDPAKWILCFAMLLGRLEIFTLLMLLTPAFWLR
jgi:trk system potassium uptake protein TrkH